MERFEMDFDKFLSEFAAKRCEEVSKKMDFDKKSSEIIKKTSLQFNDEQKEILKNFEATLHKSKRSHHAPEKKGFFDKLGDLFK